MSNLFCFKHPQYRAEKSPDLSCKTCCSLFVARIRADQTAKFEDVGKSVENAFLPMVGDLRATASETKKAPTFDSSWV